MNENLDIFILTYRDFKELEYPTNPVYKILAAPYANLKQEDYRIPIINTTETRLAPLDFCYSEGTQLFYLYEHQDILKDYVGICHYRKYFEFFNDPPAISNLLKTHDAIFAEPVMISSVFEQYYAIHCADDLMNILNLIYLFKTQYIVEAMKAFSSSTLYPCNMFIMKKEDFIDWAEFCFSILQIFCKENRFRTMADVEQHIRINEANNRFHRPPEIKQQMRICGLLLERLTNVFLYARFKSIIAYPMKLTLDEPYEHIIYTPK